MNDPVALTEDEITHALGRVPAWERQGDTITRLVPVRYHAAVALASRRLSSTCTYTGPPKDASESTRVEWVGEDDVVKLALGGEIADGPSLAALSYYLGPYWLARRT